jgi:hypothetical protein
MLVRPLSMSSPIVWLCGVKGKFVFPAEQPVWVPCGLPSLVDPLVPKMRRLRLEDSPRDRELLRLIPPLTRGRPRRRPPVRQTWDTQPPTWGLIKKLMDMMTMVTSNLGMAGNPTATLLAALVIITIQVGVVQGDAHWTFMPSLPMVHLIIW